MQRPVAVVSLKDIRANLRLLARRAGVSVIAVVKDDAYGHGAEAVAHAIADMVAMFAVATVDEGARLVAAGVGRDVLVLTPLTSDMDALRARAYGLVVTAASFPSLAFCRGLRAHLAVNTGMNRYGFSPCEIASALQAAARLDVQVEGVFSHLYEPSDSAAVKEQTRAFAACAQQVRSAYPNAVRHLCATGGILAGGASFDAVRPGLGLYGYAPPPFTAELSPAMRVFAQVVQNTAPYGGGAGYAAAAKKFSALHTLGAGYGHGFFRAGGMGAEGRLCMDACVREGRLPFGTQVCVLDDAAAYAAQHGTTAYEVLVAVGKGTEKVYDG